MSKAYGPQTLFSQIALTVSSGDRVGLLGANGAGKSTLLARSRRQRGRRRRDDRFGGATRAFCTCRKSPSWTTTPRRAQLVERGARRMAPSEAPPSRRSPARSKRARPIHRLLAEQAQVAEVIERLGGWTRDHLALQMLEHLGVRDIDRTVGTMSGGERRRVALAQLLVAEPRSRHPRRTDEPPRHRNDRMARELPR